MSIQQIRLLFDEVAEYTVDYCYRMSDIPSSYSQPEHSAEADEWHNGSLELNFIVLKV